MTFFEVIAALWAAPFIKLIIFLAVGAIVVDWWMTRNES